jgi:hypothetical protein
VSTENETKPKKSPEVLAGENGLKIFKSGYNQGKADGSKQSKDSRRRKLGRSVDTVVKARENGKNKTFKQLKSAYNGLDDNQSSYIKAKILLETAMNYFDQQAIPLPKSKGNPDQQSSESQSTE